MVTFKENVYDGEIGPLSYKVEDGSHVLYSCFSVTRYGSGLNQLQLELPDFNNASGACTFTYTTNPGILRGDITLASTLTKTFTPTGLIPVPIEPPEVANIINIEEVDPNA